MNDENIKELAVKLYQLADKGFGGEKTTAQEKLNKLLIKHNITLEEVLDDQTKEYEFKVKRFPYSKELLNQIAYKVIGIEKKVYEYKNIMFIVCTPAQKIEIQLDYDFYSKIYKDEMKRFYKAFIHAQDIFPSPEKAGKHKQLTEEEKEELIRILRMSVGIDKQKRQLVLKKGE